MKTRIIIPARLKSTRFPNKLIQLINNISLIEHICIRAKKIPCYSVIVATDDIKIKSLVEQHGIDVWFSKKKFLNGTHRIACLCKEYGFNKNVGKHVHNNKTSYLTDIHASLNRQ